MKRLPAINLRRHPKRVGLEQFVAKRGLVHFFLFLIVFITFAMTGAWAFGQDREDFVTFQTGMTSQFELLNGDFPEGWTDDNKMIFYVVLSYVVQTTSMLNFMLAIVFDSYAKVREELETKDTENDVMTDIIISAANAIRSMANKWPSGLAKKLQSKIVIEAIGSSHLENTLGISRKTALSICEAYHHQDAIRWDQNPVDACDQKLLQRAQKMIGIHHANKLVGSDYDELQHSKRSHELEREIRGLEDRLAKRFKEKIQDLAGEILGAMRSSKESLPLTANNQVNSEEQVARASLISPSIELRSATAQGGRDVARPSEPKINAQAVAKHPSVPTGGLSPGGVGKQEPVLSV